MGGGRRVLGVAVVCGVVLAACQAEESGKLTATKRQAVETGGLPWAPASNLTTQKVAQEPLSNHYVLIPKTAWETMRQSALVNGRATTNLRETRELAGTAASKANDVTSLGIYGALEVASSPQEPFLITADDVLVVAEDASVTTLGETTVVLASNLFIAGEGLVGSTPWRARGLNIALQDSPMGGGGRCCGPGLAGEPRPPAEVPGCSGGPNALCDSNIWVGDGASGGQAALRESAGLLPVQLMLLSGPELTTVRLDMAPPRGGMGPFACTQVRPECSVETGGPPPFGGWEAELPRGNPTCAPSSSVSGRRVPGTCQAAAESTMGYGVGGAPVVVRRAGGAPAGPECDGRCPECTSLEAVANTGLVPRQCWVRSTPAGGDICAADTLAKVQAIQQTLESIIQASTNTGSCGDLSDPDATCGGCEPLAGTASESCVRCTTAGGTTSTCSYFTRHHNPFATGGYAAVTSTGPSQDSSAAPRIGSDGSPRLTVEPYSPAFLPCTVGCEKPRSSPRLPSSAPRPGGVAQAAGDSQPVTPSGTVQSNPTAAPISNPGTAAATSGHNATSGDPVSLLSGALLLSSTDLSFPGPRRGLAFTRFYDSKTNTRGVLGSNWSHSYEVRVIPLRQENLPSWVDPYCAGTASIITCAMVVSGEVNRLYILDQATGLFLPQAGSMATLRKLDDSEVPDAGPLPHGEKVGWALRQPDGQVQFFDRLGYLVRDQDRFGNGLSFVHEKTAAGILAEAVCPLMPYLMSNGLWTAQVGPSGVPSNHVGCALLYGLTGFADLPQFSAGTAVTVEMFPLATTDATVTAARTKVLDSQAAGYGTPLPTGPAHKRLKRVTDDLGWRPTRARPVGSSTRRRARAGGRAGGPTTRWGGWRGARTPPETRPSAPRPSCRSAW